MVVLVDSRTREESLQHRTPSRHITRARHPPVFAPDGAQARLQRSKVTSGVRLLIDTPSHSPARLPPAWLPGKALLLHVAEQQTRGEKEQRRERGGQERERSQFEFPRVSCGPALLPSASGRFFLIDGASVSADARLRQSAARDAAPKPRLLTENGDIPRFLANGVRPHLPVTRSLAAPATRSDPICPLRGNGECPHFR